MISLLTTADIGAPLCFHTLSHCLEWGGRMGWVAVKAKQIGVGAVVGPIYSHISKFFQCHFLTISILERAGKRYEETT